MSIWIGAVVSRRAEDIVTSSHSGGFPLEGSEEVSEEGHDGGWCCWGACGGGLWVWFAVLFDGFLGGVILEEREGDLEIKKQQQVIWMYVLMEYGRVVTQLGANNGSVIF